MKHETHFAALSSKVGSGSALDDLASSSSMLILAMFMIGATYAAGHNLDLLLQIQQIELIAQSPRLAVQQLNGDKRSNEVIIEAVVFSPAAVDDAELDGAVVASQNLVLVDFWADWNATIAAIADEYAGRLAVRKINVDGNTATRSARKSWYEHAG